ncbi:class I SAM-dependent methyltransferase [Neorhizobium alkalisoli]|uniref:class I SAM-dependent methyltransferase n=1 Tax=Neorhizobium alkalisoli TaxID=528178 RepID=UPI000CFA119A|nr:class I SAM-dependent methyltransferase [Neorhizobium alkalisoli]
MQGDPTSTFYAENAEAYAGRLTEPSRRQLDLFLAKLRAGADILELGCGNGRDSAEMIKRGFHATPTDGTPEMAEEAAKRLGVPVSVLRFEDIDAVEAFDGIWANACLLHVPRAKLGGILERIRLALRPGGLFYASFKAGEAEGHDSLGRFYNYPSKGWLKELYESLSWTSIEIAEEHGTAYDKRPTDWLHVLAARR